MTTENSDQLRKRLIGKLKGLELVIGCTTEELLTVLALEISARIPGQETVNVDDIVNKVVARLPDFKVMADKISVAIESHLAVKLDEVMTLVSKGLSQTSPDPQSIIQGVAAVLQPQIGAASRQAAEAVFNANKTALTEAINKTMDERFSQLTAAAPAGGVMVQAGQPPSGPSMGSNLLAMATQNPEGLKGLAEAIKAIVEIFKPPVAQNAALNDFNKYMGFHDLMTKIEKRVATSDDIAQGIGKVFGAGSSTPAIPAQTTTPAK